MLYKKIIILAFTIQLLSVLLCAQPNTKTYVIRNVAVINVLNGKATPHSTVIINGNKIVSVGTGNVSLPNGATVIEGEGKYLIPGLWDMHVHYFNDPFTAETATQLLLANGVTGIRDMSSPVDKIVPWRDSVRRNELLGPRAFVSGPLIDGPPPATEGDILVTTPEEGRKAVKSLAEKGVDFIKVYEMLRPDVFAAIVDEAKKHHLPVAGHLPMSVDARVASDMGMTSFEHLRNVEFACSTKEELLRKERIAALNKGINSNGRALRGQILSAQRVTALETQNTSLCDAFIAILKKNKTWQTPTLFLDEAPLTFFDANRMARVRGYEEYVNKDYKEWWKNQTAGFQNAPETVRNNPTSYALWQRSFVLRLQNAGVKLLAGSDSPNLLTPTGFGLYEELLALKNAGLSNLEVLQTATINPARHLNVQNSLGTVAKGKIADIVLLNKNPLDNIENLNTIDGVFVNGVFLDRNALNSMLEDVKQKAKQNGQ